MFTFEAAMGPTEQNIQPYVIKQNFKVKKKEKTYIIILVLIQNKNKNNKIYFY
jgi:hypothetical protein